MFATHDPLSALLARVEDCTSQCDKGLATRPTVAGLSSFSYLYNTLQVEATGH